MNTNAHHQLRLSGGGDQAPLNDLDEAEHETGSAPDPADLDEATLNDLLSEPDRIEMDPNVP